MININFTIRNATQEEFTATGKLMAAVYAALNGFPKETEQPDYYKMLYNVGDFTTKPGTELLVAVDENNAIAGAVVYFSNMQYYGSGGIATQQKNACGFRLLAVDHAYRGKGIGKLLTNACIEKGRGNGLQQMIIHSTEAMAVAWKMYEAVGFKRSTDLDFMQGTLPVYGFRLQL